MFSPSVPPPTHSSIHNRICAVLVKIQVKCSLSSQSKLSINDTPDIYTAYLPNISSNFRSTADNQDAAIDNILSKIPNQP